MRKCCSNKKEEGMGRQKIKVKGLICRLSFSRDYLFSIFMEFGLNKILVETAFPEKAMLFS